VSDNNNNQPPIANTETLIAVSSKLQFMLKVATEKRVVSNDPRWDSIITEGKSLAARLEALIPPVMLNELVAIREGVTGTFAALEVEEGLIITGGTNGRDN